MSEKSAPVAYGGQAVIEGVMFGGKHVNVTAVRRKSGEITFLEVPREEKGWVRSLRKVPLLRGLVSLIDSSVKGSKHLNYSFDAYADDEMTPEEREELKAKNKNGEAKLGLGAIIGVTAAAIVSFLVGKVVFTLVPVFVEDFLFKGSFSHQIYHNLTEGGIKLILLLLYLYFISLTPIVKRLFQYHGAEHKVITAFEAGEELTPKNVQKYTRLHYRCGSSFIMLTVIIGILIYSLFSWDSLIERVVQRLLLLPVVMGVSFEFLKFTNALRDVPVLRYLGYPGLWLQLLTTKEPTDEQVEVSIASFNRMRELDAVYAKQGAPATMPDAILDPLEG